ncbi:hypothetical protein DAC19_40 [Bacteroides phage DAC19]|nr:hypothetical protein DAC19_40 [Bacteroides phage DAC19]
MINLSIGQILLIIIFIFLIIIWTYYCFKNK